MGKHQLSLEQTKEMFLHASEGMVQSKDLLTQADKAIGDGDHGVGMARGFEAVRRKLEGQTFATIDELLKAIGTALLMSVGGAAGAVFGTFFRGGAGNLGEQRVFDAGTLSRLLLDGLQAVQARGNAKPGDKTMVDALVPAATVSKQHTESSLDVALSAVAEAARIGAEKTKDMVAAVGKAKTLGERSLGHADPGATSTALILKFMTEYVTG